MYAQYNSSGLLTVFLPDRFSVHECEVANAAGCSVTQQE
jgi:hypothetical protein